MASPIELSRHRLLKSLRARRTLPLAQPSSSALASDADLRPMAIVFWAVSVARVALGLWQGQSFDAEGSLALLCVIGIPCWLVWSYSHNKQHSTASMDEQAPFEAENVIRFTGRHG